MTTETWIEVLGRKSVVVTTAADALESIRVMMKVACPEIASWRCVVVTDDGVPPHFVARVAFSVGPIGDGQTTPLAASAPVFTIPQGEASKCRKTKERVEDWMLELRCGRDTVVVAVGGGVVGDLAGFVAATYLRGVPVVHVATTLMAMVDSSVGGKTAVNVEPFGKNLVGAFHQPSLVVMPLRCLATLPRRVVIEAFAEVLKYDVIDFGAAEHRFPTKNLETMWKFANEPEQVDVAAAEDRFCSDSWTSLVVSCAAAKARVVTCDEKEAGLRETLNFGHTIGHAVEALMDGAWYHGECVAAGMVAEVEVSRALGHAGFTTVWKLRHALHLCGLPTEIPAELSPSSLLNAMASDKKNRNGNKHILLVRDFGVAVSMKSVAVSDTVIERICAAGCVPVIADSLSASGSSVDVCVPGSKSLTNRALIIAALSRQPTRLEGVLVADDTLLMSAALEHLGVAQCQVLDGEGSGRGGDAVLVTPLWNRSSARSVAVESRKVLFVGNSGTTARFLLPLCGMLPPAVCGAEYLVITGTARMCERPIGDLVDSLMSCGAAIEYLGASGCFPLKLRCGSVSPESICRAVIATQTSSQFLSALLLCSPAVVCFTGMTGSRTIAIRTATSTIVSRPFIDLTIETMKSFGVTVTESTDGSSVVFSVHVNAEGYRSPQPTFTIEGDATNATYFGALALCLGKVVRITNIGAHCLQNDRKFLTDVLPRFGATITQDATSTTVCPIVAGGLHGIGEIDMDSLTDCFMTAAVLAALSLGTTTITGIRNQRQKECDRIAAIARELRRAGFAVTEMEDGLSIHGDGGASMVSSDGDNVIGIDCYRDHRMAMSFAVLALALLRSDKAARPSCPRLAVRDWRCVEKTLPSFWRMLENSFACELRAYHPPPSSHQLQSSRPLLKQHGSPIIFLIGMRYSGKSTLGRAVAAYFGWKFIDVDTLISELNGRGPSEIVATEGWSTFREKELVAMRRAILVSRESAQPTVIACGGGFVDYAPSVALVREQGQIVVWLQKSLEAVERCHVIDGQRPSYSTAIADVLARRVPVYESLATWSFATAEREDAESSNTDAFIRYIHHIVAPNALRSLFDSDHISHFVCITPRSADEVSADLVDEVSVGCDAIELRLDSLSPCTEATCAAALNKLRRLTWLPVIVTLRSRSEGGAGTDDAMAYWSLLNSGALLAPAGSASVADVEFSRWSTLAADEQESLLRSQLCPKSRVVILSLHTTDANRIRVEGPKLVGEARRYGWLPKIVWIGAPDALSVLILRDEVLNSGTANESRSVIFIATGVHGQLSRALNRTMTPVTHARLQAAAPGQLTLRELHRVRATLFDQSPMLQWRGDTNRSAKTRHLHFLFGSPISKSKSPTIHNHIFECLGWSSRCSYRLHETADPAVAWNTVARLLSSPGGGETFRGASVTIPLKEAIMPFLDLVDEDAKRIGAVNTMVVLPGSRVAGFNTDWLGLRDALRATGLVGSWSQRPTLHVIVGAGGTARAAAFTVLRCWPLASVCIINRTESRAHALREATISALHDVDGNVASRISVGWPSAQSSVSGSAKVCSIIGTVPPAADSATLTPSQGLDLAFLDPSVVVVDFAYTQGRGAHSAFESVVAGLLQGRAPGATVTGVDVLRRQAMHQQQLWLDASRSGTSYESVQLPSCSRAEPPMFPVTGSLVELTQ